MKEYIKPTFITAGLFPVALAGSTGGCATTPEDMELMYEILGITDVSSAFATTEACTDKYDYENYCKLTSVEAGGIKLLTS